MAKKRWPKKAIDPPIIINAGPVQYRVHMASGICYQYRRYLSGNLVKVSANPTGKIRMADFAGAEEGWERLKAIFNTWKME